MRSRSLPCLAMPCHLRFQIVGCLRLYKRKETSLTINKNKIAIPLYSFCCAAFRLLHSCDRRAPSVGRVVSPKPVTRAILRGLELIGFLGSDRVTARCLVSRRFHPEHQNLHRLHRWNALTVSSPSYFVGLHVCCVDYVSIALLLL